jgi:O-acetyl-ADP-ribose deacetylase (regulator of RNase III)
MLIKKTGNLIDLAEAGEFDVVVHGCNCFNTMGGGIAREIRERYPDAAYVDSLTKRGDYTKLGNWTESAVYRDPKHVAFTFINAYTQYDMSKGTDEFAYVAFELILLKLLQVYGNKRIGLPYIGMGLAGGKPELIMPKIEAFAYCVQAKGGSVTLVKFS